MTSIAAKQGVYWWAVSDLNTRPKDYEYVSRTMRSGHYL